MLSKQAHRANAKPLKTQRVQALSLVVKHKGRVDWVAVKALKLSYYNKETLLFTIYL